MSTRKAVLVPGATSGGGGGSASGSVVHTFGLGIVQFIAVGTSVTPKITVEPERVSRFLRWRITANEVPTGASIIVDIKKNGSTIFLAGNANKIVLPAGSAEATGTIFKTSPFTTAAGDKLLPDVIQVGSTFPGFRIEIQITGTLL